MKMKCVLVRTCSVPTNVTSCSSGLPFFHNNFRVWIPTVACRPLPFFYFKPLHVKNCMEKKKQTLIARNQDTKYPHNRQLTKNIASHRIATQILCRLHMEREIQITLLENITKKTETSFKFQMQPNKRKNEKKQHKQNRQIYYYDCLNCVQQKKQNAPATLIHMCMLST